MSKEYIDKIWKESTTKSTDLETLKNDNELYTFGMEFKNSLNIITSKIGGEFMFQIDRPSLIPGSIQGMVLSHETINNLRVIWYPEEKILALHDLVIEADRRGKGHGSLIVNELEALARNLGAKEFKIISIRNDAIDFWIKNNFIYDPSTKTATKVV